MKRMMENDWLQVTWRDGAQPLAAGAMTLRQMNDFRCFPFSSNFFAPKKRNKEQSLNQSTAFTPPPPKKIHLKLITFLFVINSFFNHY